MTTSLADTLVVTDLDGTFWDDDQRCHPDTIAAVRELDARGASLLIATGRRQHSARDALLANDLEVPAVLLNGALGVDFCTGTRFHARTFMPAEIVGILTVCNDHGINPAAYLANGNVTAVGEPTTHADYRSSLDALFTPADSITAIASLEVMGFSSLGQRHDDLAELPDRCAHVADAAVYQDRLYGPWSIHIQPTGVTKQLGIDAWLASTGFRPGRVIAIGDQTNDIEMLAHADLAIAVNGGHPSVLEMADLVIGEPHEGGWASVLDHV